MIDVQREF